MRNWKEIIKQTKNITERIPLRRAVAVSKFPLHLGAIQDDSLRNA